MSDLFHSLSKKEKAEVISEVRADENNCKRYMGPGYKLPPATYKDRVQMLAAEQLILKHCRIQLYVGDLLRKLDDKKTPIILNLWIRLYILVLLPLKGWSTWRTSWKLALES